MAMASRIKCSKNFSTALGRLTKRLMDFSIALVALSTLVIPIMIVAIIITGHFKGNPFFVQRRLGYKKRVITLFKFKSMHVMHDESGKLLPDEERLDSFGRFLSPVSRRYVFGPLRRAVR